MKLKGNQPILLNDPAEIWIVQSGEIALFAIKIANNSPVGSRRYLFSCKSGEAILGTFSSPDIQQGILALAMGEAEIVKMDSQQWQTFVKDQKPQAVTMVSSWIKKLAGTFSEFETELLDVFVIDDLFSLQEELAPLYSQFFHAINLQQEQEQAEALINLQARERFNTQAKEAALHELGSLLPQIRNGSNHLANYGNLIGIKPEFIPLYTAAYAVGRAMGIAISPPLASANFQRLREPLEAIAHASRIRMRRVILTDYWWEQDCGALLAYTREGHHPVALLPVSPRCYQIFDPVEKTRIPVNAQTVTMLTPGAYTFYKPLPERQINAVDLFKFAFKGHIQDLFVLLWVGVVMTGLGMFTPIATGVLIDFAIPNANQGLLVQIGLGLLAASFGQLIFKITQAFSMMRLEILADTVTQPAVWDRLLNLPLPFFRQYSTGDLRSRVSAVSSIRRQLGGNTLQTLFTSLVALPNLGLLFYYNWQLALVAVLILLVNFITTTLVGTLTLNPTRRSQDLEGNIFGLMVQLINGVSKLRVSGAEERAFAHWSKNYSLQQKLKLKIQQLQDHQSLFSQVLPNFSLAILFSVAAIAQTNQQGISLSTGTFLAFNAAFAILLSGTTSFGELIINFLAAIALWERIKPIMETVPEVDASKADPGQLSGRLSLEQINFSYRPDTPLVLDNVNIQAEPGEFIALVGASGSGKSTVLRLLLGFETPSSGKVYYDGQDLQGLNIQAVRRQLGVVLQTSRINTASIFENIAGGALITMDEAWQAAHQVGLGDDIAAMPMEMHTVISEGGSNVSGGQRQRILLARAIVLKPRILLLDEATSALDNCTQAIVTDNLERLQVTRVVIAHRLSTVRKADRIYVFQAGRIVQQGSFEELINQPGVFAKLMQLQMI